MRILVACIGQRMPGWVDAAWNEYARRMPRNLPLELKALPLPKRARNAGPERYRRQEGEALLGAVPQGYAIVALDRRGRAWRTDDLAERLETWQEQARHRALLIGGPDGLDAPCLDAADEVWSLGPLTFPHALVRVILAEQIYRAWTITQNHPYHRS